MKESSVADLIICFYTNIKITWQNDQKISDMNASYT